MLCCWSFWRLEICSGLSIVSWTSLLGLGPTVRSEEPSPPILYLFGLTLSFAVEMSLSLFMLSVGTILREFESEFLASVCKVGPLLSRVCLISDRSIWDFEVECSERYCAFSRLRDIWLWVSFICALKLFAISYSRWLVEEDCEIPDLTFVCYIKSNFI